MEKSYNELVFSSYGLFTVGIIAMLHDKVIIGICLCVAAISSLLFWGAPSDTTLMLDKFSATFLGAVITIYFIVHATGYILPVVGWAALFTTALLYYTSVRLFEANNEMWKIFHVLFHSMGVLTSFIIVIS